MKDINQVNWEELGAANIPHWLQDLQSKDTSLKLHSESYNELWQFLIPENESWKDQLQMMESEVHHLIVPFLIDILESADSPTHIGSMLELLELLARRWFVRTNFSDTNPNKLRWERWARQINDTVREGIPIYQNLLNNSWASVREGAQELLKVLEQTKA